jgi:hydrogenase nickel incorporation protein HypA/HybF
MHELSIADAVYEVASRHADGRRVSRVELRVGHLRQVVPDALGFAWQLLTQGTQLAGAELAIEEVPAAVRCQACGAESVLEGFPALCGVCGSASVDVTGGDELLVDSLELEEQEEAAVVGRVP